MGTQWQGGNQTWQGGSARTAHPMKRCDGGGGTRTTSTGTPGSLGVVTVLCLNSARRVNFGSTSGVAI
eukprot:SAG31_NODE_23282_length_507_cov_1.058824_2_plen_67_part_01